jgi:branched-chain amino acid transport system substrate-binding protein
MKGQVMTRASLGGLTRRGALGSGIGLAASILLAACVDDDQAVTVDPNESGEVVVGANLELSGTGSTLGKLQEQALQIGVEEINVTGIPFGSIRLKVRLVVRDNGGDPKTAARIVDELIDQDKVSAIVGGTTVETAQAMVTVAEARRVPLLCLNSGDTISVPLPERKFIYQLGPNATDVATAIARELRIAGLVKVGVLASPDGHGDAGVRALPRALTATDRNLTSTVRMPAAGRPFGSAVSEVLRGKPAAVIVWSLAPNSAEAVAALRTAGFKGVIFLDPGAGADETLNGPHSAAVEGSYIVHPAVLAGAPLMATTPSDRAARAFIYRYIQRYGTFSGFAPYGADALTLVATAVRRAVSVDPQRVRGRLEAGAIEAISGAYNFRPISHGGLEPDALTLFVARHGTWIKAA